jgi:hypothetical protein
VEFLSTQRSDVSGNREWKNVHRERERKLIITNINISCAHEHRQANDAGEIKASERMDGWM